MNVGVAARTACAPVHVAGAAIPSIALGTGRLRGDVLLQAVEAALACGYRHIDTAAKYGNEAEVGEAIASAALPRSELFITTKAMPRTSAAEFLADVQAGVERLRLDQVDLLLIHWPEQRAPLRGQLDALCEARRRGLARHIGLSNFPPRYVDAAVAMADAPLVVNQVERHPYLDQSALAATCARHGIALMAFCPLGRGALLDEPVVRDIAVAHGRSNAQVVLRWQLSLPMAIVAPRSSQPGRIADNFGATDFVLTADELRRISALARPDGRVVRGPEGFDWDGVPLID
jgi:diketogulonate reductase-like aldo/keto reductase